MLFLSGNNSQASEEFVKAKTHYEQAREYYQKQMRLLDRIGDNLDRLLNQTTPAQIRAYEKKSIKWYARREKVKKVREQYLIIESAYRIIKRAHDENNKETV